MVKRCPPGVLCFENMTFIIIAVVVIGVGIYMHSRVFGHGLGLGHDCIGIDTPRGKETEIHI